MSVAGTESTAIVPATIEACDRRTPDVPHLDSRTESNPRGPVFSIPGEAASSLQGPPSHSVLKYRVIALSTGGRVRSRDDDLGMYHAAFLLVNSYKRGGGIAHELLPLAVKNVFA